MAIHPAYKQAVGERLALAALKVAYGMELVCCGPTFKRAKFEGAQAIVEFENVGAGLCARELELDLGKIYLSAGELCGFAVCGADKCFKWAKASYNSIHGKIATAWKLDGSALQLDVTIPANTTATVYVPAKDAAAVTESGKPTGKVEGVKLLRMENNAAVYAVGSGTYQFQSTLSLSVQQNTKGESK